MRDSTKKTVVEAARRGRPRAYDPVEALLRATDVFWKAGYSRTSLDDVSAATGMNRPSLYAAFGDKHSLYLSALLGYWTLKFEVIRESLDGGTLVEALLRTYDAALAVYFPESGRARGCFVVGTAITETVEDREIGEIVAAGFRRLDADFATRFRAAREQGELRADADPEALAMLATATMQSAALRARAGAPQPELREMARKAVAVMCS